MREGAYQTKIINKLKTMFPGCVVLKNDSSYIQGIPDLTVFYNDRWAMLEVKISKDASSQPNQEHYIHELDAMSFAAFIYPENEEAVLSELQSAFRSPRKARVSKS
jgi:hypothetical protein